MIDIAHLNTLSAYFSVRRRRFLAILVNFNRIQVLYRLASITKVYTPIGMATTWISNAYRLVGRQTLDVHGARNGTSQTGSAREPATGYLRKATWKCMCCELRLDQVDNRKSYTEYDSVLVRTILMFIGT